MQRNKLLLAAVAAALLSSSCGYYAGIAVAPNGVVWIAKNASGGLGGPQSEGVYACLPHGLELQCTRMPTRGMDN